MFLDRKIAEWDPEPITLAWLYREAISYFVTPENGFSELSGFPLWHPDFSNCNFLFDDEHNITGVIDWSETQSVPWELFACFPHELGRRVTPSGDVDADSRALFLSIFEEEERQVDSRTPMTKFMGSTAGRIAELVEGYQHMQPLAGNNMPWHDVHELISLMYGEGVKWEDVKSKARAALQH